MAQGLRAAGHSAWFVGGGVRDRLLGLEAKDHDLATDARPEVVAAIFPQARLVGASFGVTLVPMGEERIEVATFRRDGAYLDHRHPESVAYGSMEDDAARRDFTVNALFEHPETGDICDFHGGLADLRARRLRCVGDPRRRFREDALRLLRAVRFAARLGFEIEQETWLAMRELAPTIDYVSPERQRDELTAMFTGPDPRRALELLDGALLLPIILPEIDAMHGVEQRKRIHPKGDVFVHTALVLHHVEPRSAINAWAALLHDVGKPPTFARDPETGKITFYGHQKVGAVMAREILERFKASREVIDTVAGVVARHMDFMNVTRMNRATLRRFLGAPTIEHDLAVHRADCLGSWGKLDSWEFCRTALEQLRAEEGAAVPPPLVTGHDVMALGVPAGKRVGELLRTIQDWQLEGVVTTREEALEKLAGLIDEGRG